MGSISVLRGLLAHGAAEEFGQRGIEGGAGLLLDLLQGFVDGEGCSFWLFGGKVVKHLGDADNASKQGCAFFSQTKGVARSVPSLMMEGDNLHGVG